jgi:hypothetical protein
MKILQKIYTALDMPSGTGIGLIVLNSIGWCWYDVIKHGLGMQEVALVGAIFAAKTTHGVLTKDSGE